MNTKSTMYVKLLFPILIAVLVLMPASLEAKKQYAKGTVFEDTNGNGVMDNGEKGIPGAAVSNQIDVVKTDENGRYRIRVYNKTILFVIKPSGYNVPVDSGNFPKFYYIHQPKGSPKGLKFEGIAPTGKLPASIDFPLLKGKEEGTFNVVVVADPQTKTAQEIDYYRDDVVARLVGSNAAFYLALGDIMYDDLSLISRMKQVVGHIGIPLYSVMGNHDMNYRVTEIEYEAETFKRSYGPDYYSFNYGTVHFVVMNSVKYNGWNGKENKKGRYVGNFHGRQLEWLKNDLALVPEDHLVVFSMHIPVAVVGGGSPYNEVGNRAEFFKLLENREHLLVLAGHMHHFEYLEFTSEHGWNGKAVFPSITAGAGCGTWWHGPMDPRGIPFGMCTDGVPNGHFEFKFSGNQYSYRFVPGSTSPEEHMRINRPFGVLSQEQLKSFQINVNVFTGTTRTNVTYRMDDGPEQTMKRTIMKDPFFDELVKKNKDSFIDWMEPTPSTHTWEAPMPEQLKPGIHRLKVTVKDHQGNVFTAYRLFEVK
jgi:3',5'-cyclic AMP phosphodiesterase CpdA